MKKIHKKDFFSRQIQTHVWIQQHFHNTQRSSFFTINLQAIVCSHVKLKQQWQWWPNQHVNNEKQVEIVYFVSWFYVCVIQSRCSCVYNINEQHSVRINWSFLSLNTVHLFFLNQLRIYIMKIVFPNFLCDNSKTNLLASSPKKETWLCVGWRFAQNRIELSIEVCFVYCFCFPNVSTYTLFVLLKWLNRLF